MLPESQPFDKATFRTRCRGYRSALDATVHERLSRAIIDRALDSGAFAPFDVIHVYWPIVERREVDTRPLIAALQGLAKRVVIPAVGAGPSGEPTTSYRLFEGAENMQKNIWGTYEPPVGKAVPPSRIDLVVAPALGADRLGYRLGYGGGFYDRLLKQTGCPALSLVYSACLFDSVPHDPHDVKVDLIVTEEELIRPGNLQPRRPRDRNH